MEPKFQTSFIPKKPIASAANGMPQLQRPHGAGTSIFMTLAVLLFVLSLAGVGGAYLWKQYLLGAQTQYKQDLADREKRFNIDQIEQLKSVNIQIDTAKQLLVNHLAVSEIFGIISKLTIENVRFLSLDLVAPATAGGDLLISMKGNGTNLSAVAFQSDVLGSLEQYGLRKVVKNPIIANPALDQTGAVAFGFTATIDPSSLSYESLITGSSTPN